MTTPLLIGLTLLLLVLTAFWAMARTRRIREAAQQREEEALARVRAGAPPLSLDGETVFEAAGLPSRLPERRGIEVSEHNEVVDLEALLAGEPQGVAHRARATLEEPTNISLDLDTLPPRPTAPPAQVASAPAPASPAATPPAAPVLQSLSSMHPPSAAFATPMATPTPTPTPAAPARPAPSRAQPSPPTLVARLPGDAERRVAPPAMPPAAATPRPVPSPAPLPAGGGATIRRGNDDVPLRELTLAWFEARGYRSAPASSAVRPIEQVLRHRHDPARAYAFVVESARLTADRVQQLRNQARAIGLLRVLIVADAGAEEGAATKSKGVRVMDRASLAAEFDQLDFSVAAKIIAVARKRSGVPITVH
jgi:hypothetical protein